MIESSLIALIIFLLGGYIGLAYFVYSGLVNTSVAGSDKSQEITVKISVIVALRNEEANAEALIESLKLQDYHDYEVVLVDDKSTDRTFDILKNSCSTLGSNFKVISAGENKFGWGPKKNAINHGIESSSGEIIALTDADCRPGKKWLSSISRQFSERTGVVVGYSPLVFAHKILSNRLKSLEALATGIISAAFIGLDKPFIATGRNLAYRKDLYYEIGRFGKSGESPAGDDDLFIQSIGSKSKVVFSFDDDTIVPSLAEKGGYIERKKRHFNSTKKYKIEFKLFGALVFSFIGSFSIILIAGIIAGSIALFMAGLIAMQVKIIVDLWLLEVGSKALKDKYRIFDVIIAELLQVPYTLILQPISLMGKFNWRGRKF